MLAEQGQLEQALTHAQQTVELEPTSPLAHLLAGRLLVKLDRREQAVAAFERVLQLDSANAEAAAALKVLKSQ